MPKTDRTAWDDTDFRTPAPPKFARCGVLEAAFACVLTIALVPAFTSVTDRIAAGCSVVPDLAGLAVADVLGSAQRVGIRFKGATGVIDLGASRVGERRNLALLEIAGIHDFGAVPQRVRLIGELYESAQKANPDGCPLSAGKRLRTCSAAGGFTRCRCPVRR
ncbi:hypothetical protein [Kibdelosporangium phytohabitans]|uniref:hypothetical protein n=1 Tax=Kibdelosporangium phytohabitans TaxID=860235 RepID=UPI0012F83D69|nr:hypothetical protein [Kibdelosporangium phytohabitans]MBE1470647.1 hypothetical protein [Kibdelosporangium phytohabitans]